MPLSTPDFWEFTLPESRTCLLTDDGSSTTSQLAQMLTQRGWQVVVLSFPQNIITTRQPLDQGGDRIELNDLSEEHLQQQLTIISNTYGSIGSFIHLHPVSQQLQTDRVVYSKSEKSILKYVFLLAKHLKRSLNSAAQTGRSSFLTVARLDGEFGLGARMDFSALSGGLFGLTKTLNLEWEEVFCRAIDLSPELNAEAMVDCIFSEMHDPNSRILEVGYNLRGRVTLVREIAAVA
jgi:hypothetical protein